MNTETSSVRLVTYTTVHIAIDRPRNDGEKKTALLMYSEQVSSAPPAWTELGTVGEQFGTDLRWFARHIMVTHGSCTFFSQSCLDLLRVLGTLKALAKVANTSFLLFSIPRKHYMRDHAASHQEPTAAAPRFLDET